MIQGALFRILTHHTELLNVVPSNCYLLTPWSRVLLEKLTGFQLVKKFPEFYGIRRFSTTFTSARHLFLSWASSIQCLSSHPTSWRSILILSSHLCPGLSNDLFPSCFPTKILYMPLLTPIHATCPAYLILLDSIIRTILGEEYRSLSSSLCSFLHYVVTSSLLGPNILLNTLFSNTLSLQNTEHNGHASPENPQPRCERPGFTPTQNNRQIYTSLYLSPYILG